MNVRTLTAHYNMQTTHEQIYKVVSVVIARSIDSWGPNSFLQGVQDREEVQVILSVYIVFASARSLHFLFPIYIVQQFLYTTGEYGNLYRSTGKLSMNFPVPAGLSIK